MQYEQKKAIKKKNGQVSVENLTRLEKHSEQILQSSVTYTLACKKPPQR